MKQLLVRGSVLAVDDVAPPSCVPEHVLVRTAYSCVSVGTELAGIGKSSQPLWRRAIAERGRIQQVVSMAQSVGVRSTIDFVQGKLGASKVLGYSLAGHVVGLGAGVAHVTEGDLVACGGAQCANHAEIVAVPKNLVVRAPSGIAARDASMATVGAIALQGVRRAAPTIGESFLVIGLGLIGLLTVQMLKANGCVVIGADLQEARRRLARDVGADFTLGGGSGDDMAVLEMTHGFGADGVIVAAGGGGDEIMATAFRLTRKKGRVVIVGDVGLSLNRADFYAKEIDVLISCSYGPGRYDHAYEEEGLDYPLPYVRWTEARNMECFMGLVARKRVSIDAFQPMTVPLEKATEAYASLAQKGSGPLAVFFSYGAEPTPAPRQVEAVTQVVSPRRLRLALVGAGGFAGAVHVPNLKQARDRVEIVAVAGRTGHKVAEVARNCGARIASTDVEAVLGRSDVDAVLIATRHDSHTQLARLALEQGKHVFVEKPTATTPDELASLDATIARLGEAGRLPVLMTGYNRRFSSLAVRVKEAVRGRACPMVLQYRMAAGFLPADHWTKGPEGGGRNIGEACHIYDLFGFLVGSPVESVSATRMGGRYGAYQLTDNFVATVRYEDGSVATLVYTAQGSPALDKERLELFSERTALVLDNWRSLTTYDQKVDRLTLRAPDKGFVEELAAFVAATTGGRAWPIPWREQKDAALVSFRVQEQLRGGVGCAD
jgi:predicted dehydrogenase/threonine dehydrogenase-like Zn-dependent dehydrogenase